MNDLFAIIFDMMMSQCILFQIHALCLFISHDIYLKKCPFKYVYPGVKGACKGRGV